ncbi:GL15358 [Drosophila persimilis]|nr:GL15358 [Drosophila persimilis]
MEDSTSSKSDGDGSDQEDGIGGMGMAEREREPKLRQVEDDELGDGLKVTLSSDGSLDTNDSFNSHRHHPLNHQDAIGGIMGMAPNAL